MKGQPAMAEAAQRAGAVWLKQSLSTRPPRVALVFLVLFVLFLVTSLLSKAYRSHLQNLSVQHYSSGQAEAAQGRYGEAIEHYRVALSQERGNASYRLALALALMETHRLNEAETHFRELLQHDPTHGLANLTMARISTIRGRMEEAQQFYR
ncbi:MAG: tetratricopeptide repeat protein, partial [Bryobacteraceae bacterium]